MESIDKLREWSHSYDNAWVQKDGSIVLTTNIHGVYYGENYGEAIRQMIDSVEEEIAERYMELPVDADGVPIRIGDTVTANDWRYTREVVGFAVVCKDEEGYRVWHEPHELTHVKPRTLEDVLTDFAEAIEERGTEWVDASQTANAIRELLGVEK